MGYSPQMHPYTRINLLRKAVAKQTALALAVSVVIVIVDSVQGHAVANLAEDRVTFF